MEIIFHPLHPAARGRRVPDACTSQSPTQISPLSAQTRQIDYLNIIFNEIDFAIYQKRDLHIKMTYVPLVSRQDTRVSNIITDQLRYTLHGQSPARVRYNQRTDLRQ